MGKAGYLPDISGRFNQWTGLANKLFAAKDYQGAVGALNNMNALLGEDYRIIISTDQYRTKLAEEKWFQCNYCTMEQKQIVNPGDEEEIAEYKTVPYEVNYSDIKVFELRTGFLEYAMLATKANKVWRCPNCKNINKMSQTGVIESEHENPSYFKVVPDPPIRTSSNRVGFDKNFQVWFNNYSKELENALMNYRVDYIKEHGEDMSDLDFEKGDKT